MSRFPRAAEAVNTALSGLDIFRRQNPAATTMDVVAVRAGIQSIMQDGQAKPDSKQVLQGAMFGAVAGIALGGVLTLGATIQERNNNRKLLARETINRLNETQNTEPHTDNAVSR